MIFNFMSTKDAETLQGHGAEFFASSEILNENILEKSLTLNVGVHNYHLGNNYPTSTLPNVNYVWGSASVFVRSKGSPFVILWGIKTPSINCPPTFNYYNGAEWSGWNDLFTTAGGTVNGNVRAVSEIAEARHFVVGNSLRKLSFGVRADGSAYIYDDTKWSIILDIPSDATKTKTFYGVASGNVPLNGGGEVTGTLKVKNTTEYPLKAENTNAKNVYTAYYGENGNWLGALGFSEYRPSYRTTGGDTHSLHHDGNSAKVVISETAPSDTSALWVY